MTKKVKNYLDFVPIKNKNIKWLEDSFGIINIWRKKFDEIDVELPKLILWNAQSRNDTQLSDKNDPNVSFISGCSAATFSHLDTLISKSSYSAMVEILSSPQFQWQ